MKKFSLLALFALLANAGLNVHEILYSNDTDSYTLLQTGNENLDILLKNRLLGICENENNTANLSAKCVSLIKNLDVNKYITDISNQRNKEYQDDEAIPEGMSSEYIAEQSFVSQKGNLVQIKNFTYIYAGGAHGMENTDFIIYDLAQDRQIFMGDILTNPSAKNALYNEIFEGYENLIRTEWSSQDPKCDKKCQDNDVKEFVQNFWEHNSVDEIIDYASFYFTDEGVAFVYSPYMIAPYAMGEPEIIVPYDNLHGIIKAEFLNLDKK